MMKFVQGVVTVSAFFSLTTLHAATVTGTVKYDGAVPKLDAPKLDATCQKLAKEPAKSEVLVLGGGNVLANVIVQVKGGKGSAPAKTATIDQHGCRYVPHVVSMTAGQDLKVLNSDGIMHNLHGLGKKNPSFNAAMPASRKDMTKKFDQEETFEMKCDVHPWMKSYIGVFKHNFHAVTDASGKFSIAGLDPGTYEVEAWHEKLGTQKLSITVAKDETKTADFTFKK